MKSVILTVSTLALIALPACSESTQDAAEETAARAAADAAANAEVLGEMAEDAAAEAADEVAEGVAALRDELAEGEDPDAGEAEGEGQP